MLSLTDITELRVKAGIPQNGLIEASKANTRIQNLKNSIGTLPNRFYQEVAKPAGEFIKETAQGIAKAPLNVAQTLSDIPGQLQGKAPSEGYDVPLLGHVQGAGKTYNDLLNKPGYTPLLAGVHAASQGIADAAITGGMAQSAVDAYQKLFPSTPLKPTITIGGKKMDLDFMHSHEGTKFFQELSPADQVKFADFDHLQSRGLMPKEINSLPLEGRLTPEQQKIAIQNLTVPTDQTKGLFEQFANDRFNSIVDEYVKEPIQQVPLDKVQTMGARGAPITPPEVRRPITTPVLIDKAIDGTFHLIDGTNRVFQAIANGEKTIPAFVKDGIYSKGNTGSAYPILGNKVNLIDWTKNNFPFTDEAKQLLSQAVISNPHSSISDNLSGLGGASFLNNPIPNVQGEYSIPRIGKEPQIHLYSHNPDTLAHEMLHYLFEQGAMGNTLLGEKSNMLDRIGNNQEVYTDRTPDAKANSIKFRADFNKYWDKNVGDNDDMKTIDKKLDKLYGGGNKYNMREYSLATERFAFLGEHVLTQGVDVIPKPLQKFYNGIIEGATLEGGKRTPPTPPQELTKDITTQALEALSKPDPKVSNK